MPKSMILRFTFCCFCGVVCRLLLMKARGIAIQIIFQSLEFARNVTKQIGNQIIYRVL